MSHCRPRLSFGFGFYSSPVVYPVYPVTTTVYEPYPVYTPVYQPYPVVSSTTGVVTDTTSSESGVFVGFGPDEQGQAAVVVDQPRATSVVDSPRDQEPPATATSELENGAQVVDIPAPDDSAGSGILPEDEMSRLMKEGVEAFARGDYEPSAQLFLRVAMADPENVDAALAYATSRFATGDYPMAAVAIRRGVRRAPDVVNAPFDLRDRYGQTAHFDRQLMVLADWAAEHPDDIDALVVLGFVQHFIGQRDEAAGTFKRLKALSETDADLADSFLNAKSIEEITASQE